MTYGYNVPSTIGQRATGEQKQCCVQGCRGVHNPIVFGPRRSLFIEADKKDPTRYR